MQHHPLRILYRLIFPLRAWLAALLFLPPVAVFVICVPGQARRRRSARQAGRMLFRLAGIPVKVMGLERLPPEPCFLAANHASYLDGLLLTAALPPRFGFVIKREVTRAPLLGRLLARLGSEFVERFDTKAARSDAGRLIHLARGGVSLGAFPEGTFRREPGLRPFQLGTFLAATRAGIPVVPVVIRGARGILPADTLRPRPGKVEIEVLPAVYPGGKRGADARALRDGVRARILAHCGEPDHAHAALQHPPKKAARAVVRDRIRD
ncbi:MAG: 1-acyl-sn-glycerol-3-phosphate acyltransferase [Gammaproteobacteria bacterium]|nr:1-acyl-sn-glycerol-3-phosphate acyltransferase [Gammaproteobacteria bacterium]